MIGRKSTDADHRIARKIRTMRLEREMSQHDLAAALGVSYQQIQKYEQGLNRISAGKLLELAEAFDVPIEEFYRGVSVTRRKQVRELRPTSESLQLLRSFLKITDAASGEQILAYVRAKAPR